MNAGLILFDIDGTLISTHGIPRIAMGNVLKRRFAHFNYHEGYNFSGRTDWEIIEHLLRFDNRPANTGVVKEIMSEFASELEVEINNGKKPYIYPGVKELLERLAESENVFLGLVTGNISQGAYVKLSAAGLIDYFQVGSYGDDARHRSNLPPIAISRAEKHFSKTFDKRRIWVIGDSVHDVSCARDNQLRCLAVSTGWTEYGMLAETKPDYIAGDLTDVEKISGILSGKDHQPEY